jgi:transcriptional regulator with XRE-family HTH domain
MVFDLLIKLGQGRWVMPNNFTIGMGELIRNAREELNLSQASLARKVYRHQASMSDIENGKMQPDAETLVYLSLVLRKPISYFFPKHYVEVIDPDEIHPLLHELLTNAAHLSDEDLQRLIVQTRALANNRSKPEK